MAQTFEQAISAVSLESDTLLDRLRRLKALIDAVNSALFNYASGGGVIRYKVNTGQTQIEVECGSLSELRAQRRELYAEYNELYGIYTGGNVMVARDAATNRR